MKKLLCLLCFFVSITYCSAQNNLDSLRDRPFYSASANTQTYFAVIGLGHKALYLTADSKTGKISQTIIHPLQPKTSLIYLEGAKRISLKAEIPKDSLNQYRYTVINGDGLRLTKRGQIPVSSRARGKLNDADFGSYDVAHQNLKVSAYKVGEEEDEHELIILTQKLKPAQIVEANLTEVYKNGKVTRLEKNKQGDTTLIEQEVSWGVNLNIQGQPIPSEYNYSYAMISIKPIENAFLYSILIKRQESGHVETTTLDNLNWTYNELGNLAVRLDVKNFDKPGKYEIVIFPKIGKISLNNTESTTKINFELRKPALSTKEIGLYAGLVFVMLLLVFAVIIVATKRKNKRKLMAEQQQKDLAKTQLATVRSQLNPHFLFNALAGIQNLMNQHKTDDANRYLAKFARLTRNVLDNKELISLADEKALLDDYLQMEQLRFGFAYQINIDPQLVIADVEIPAMLLQPFVENAVKHGIAEMEEAGQISIEFTKQNENLVLTVKDNGQGFDTAKSYEGLGLQLSKNRIALLNTIYKQTPFLLHLNGRANETTITITLTQWL